MPINFFFFYLFKKDIRPMATMTARGII